MVEKTQSDDRLERQENHIQRRKMYDMVSQQFTRCICDTRRKSPGRKPHHKVFRDKGQKRLESQSQEVIPDGQGAYEGIR